MNKNFPNKFLVNALLSLVVILLLVLVVLISKTNSKIEQLDRRTSNMEDTVNGLHNNILDSVSSSLYKMEETVNKEVSITTEYSYKLQKIKDGEATIDLKATPKTYNRNLAGKFLIETEEGKRYEIEAMYNGVEFEATLQLPLFKVGKLLLQLSENEIITTQNLTNIYLLDDIMLDIDTEVNRNTSSLDGQGNFSIENSIDVIISNSKLGAKDARIELCDIVTTLNNNEIYREPFKNVENNKYTYEYNNSFTVNDGDLVAIKVIVKDNNGLLYTLPIDSYSIVKTSSGYEFDFDEEIKDYEDTVKYVG